ncbi:MAG TPA: CehA/McbA family metallohydrolase [Verrucomicrobiales bacterium]|nr:CehA/McbA family metallohydrolase [Verrucomicrobiales bacterium]
MKALSLALAVIIVPAGALRSEDSMPVTGVEAQPLLVHVQRLQEALTFLGEPLHADESAALGALKADDGEKVAATVQQVLDKHCLALVNINPEARVKAASGPAVRTLSEGGWRHYLIKVHNEAGSTAPLAVASPQAKPVPKARQEEVADRWLEASMFDSRPLEKTLSGLKLEYRILGLYSRDAGKRSAVLAFNVGQGTQDLGFRADLTATFDCTPAREVMLRLTDENGKPSTAALEIRDHAGRVYPSMAKRLAPDFFFHPQVYRTDGEKLKLPRTALTVSWSRGPEYLTGQQKLDLTGDQPTELKIQLKRWIDPAGSGWWSGDHHIHAAGCAHYTNPTQGVHAPDMMLHCIGEDLKIGANLTWGPCFDYQKQFFTGVDDKVSRPPYLLRYDIEVSGFGSHQSGHLCLLRLKEQMYPGGDSDKHWPTLCLNTLRWAQKQGAVCGPAHSGWGLQIKDTNLPTEELPPFDGIGACEYIVDVTHKVPGPDGNPVPAVDFISTVDTPWPYELNIWYHTLNCGYRTRISGETDFPCIYGERVGLGRSYVKVKGPLSYEAWCEGVSEGRNYVGDGRSHLMDFKLGDHSLGDGQCEVSMDAPGKLKATVNAAALLDEKPMPGMKNLSPDQKPYWHVERARLGDSREVKVELLVNGRPAASQNIKADGTTRPLQFDVDIQQSSWVALRILPSSHTNPFFVTVAGKPIRPSRRSVEWCLKGVEKCWSQKERFIAAKEKADAIQAYDHARMEYRRILGETDAE